jgi:hypothetical protein
VVPAIAENDASVHVQYYICKKILTLKNILKNILWRCVIGFLFLLKIMWAFRLGVVIWWQVYRHYWSKRGYPRKSNVEREECDMLRYTPCVRFLADMHGITSIAGDDGAKKGQTHMADVEFGVDVETGYDPSIGDAYEAGGTALDYATGADAVDAALGAVRRRILGGRQGGRGYVSAGAKKASGMFTYMVSMNPASTAAQTAFMSAPGQIASENPKALS